MSEEWLFAFLGVLFGGMLLNWTVREFRAGEISPILPNRWREPTYVRADRPIAFWLATAWNSFGILCFLAFPVIKVLEL